jgi:hypothetical protein
MLATESLAGGRHPVTLETPGPAFQATSLA